MDCFLTCFRHYIWLVQGKPFNYIVNCSLSFWSLVLVQSRVRFRDGLGSELASLGARLGKEIIWGCSWIGLDLGQV